MKRLFPIPLLLIFSAIPAAAGPLAPSVEELRARIFAPAEASGPPTVVTKAASCTATNDCGPHSATISCSVPTPGVCTTGPDFVECNGVRQRCAPCRVTTRCDPPDGRTLSCTGANINDCEVESRCFVRCGTSFKFCSSCP